jgi:hypothetical protein
MSAHAERTGRRGTPARVEIKGSDAVPMPGAVSRGVEIWKACAVSFPRQAPRTMGENQHVGLT